MKTAHWLWMAAVVLSSAFAGCKDTSSEMPKASNNTDDKRDSDDKLTTNLVRLDPADRKLAEAQKFCAVENENRLGSMGVPIKLLVKDQPVFLCCKGCQKK